MTQEEFDKQFEMATNEVCAKYMDEVEKDSVLAPKVANCVRAAFVLFQMNQTRDVDMEDWECWSAKYLLGLDGTETQE